VNDLACLDDVSGDIKEKCTQEAIQALEDFFRQQEQLDIPVTHTYSGGIYARGITIPKDTWLTGRIYADDHFDVMVYGDVTVSGDEGSKRLEGFNIFPGKRGKKRAGYAHEETRWITFHTCKEMADDDYLDHLTCEEFAELPGLMAKSDYIEEVELATAYQASDSVNYLCFRSGYLSALGKKSKLDADREDYHAVLDEFGFTDKMARAQSENTSDMVSIIHDYRVTVSESIIDGAGLYALDGFDADSIIMPATINDHRTIGGRYTNHSIAPNATMIEIEGDFYVKSLNNIAAGEEITIDYRVSLNLRMSKGSI